MNGPDPNFWRDQIFSDIALALAFFGGLGGAVRAMVLKTRWAETARVMSVGAATAFGLGTLAPMILKPIIGDLPPEISGHLGTLCATAFVVGLINVALVERFVIKAKGGGDDPKAKV